MRYSVEIKKFLYSQYFYGGLRIAVGVSLPAILCLIVFHDRELGFTIAAGALTNTPAHLLDWIEHAQRIKPETLMPDITLNTGDAAALSAYLATLH